MYDILNHQMKSDGIKTCAPLALREIRARPLPADTVRVPKMALRIRASFSYPPVQAISITAPPRRRRPLTSPSGQADGRAGSK
jgi:hypothetical protein